MTHRPFTVANITTRSAIAWGDWEPDEDFEEWAETGGWNLDRIHPDACWYTIGASPTERLEHYRDRVPACEFFACEGSNWGGYWMACDAPPGPHHEHVIAGYD